MNKEELISYLSKININITKEELNDLDTYKELLQEYNKKFNLTSITKDEDIYLKHFYDSLYLMSIKEFDNNLTLLDIGVGAGFPSIPLSILNRNMKITLVESNGKKCDFLNKVKELLKLDNIEVINDRAENFARNNTEKYDLVTSRAVSHLKVLLELSVPSLKINGLFIPLKGDISNELKESSNMISTLSTKLIKIYNYTLPIENSKRSIPVIKKEKETNKIYPREYSKIIKEIKSAH